MTGNLPSRSCKNRQERPGTIHQNTTEFGQRSDRHPAGSPAAVRGPSLKSEPIPGHIFPPSRRSRVASGRRRLPTGEAVGHFPGRVFPDGSLTGDQVVRRWVRRWSTQATPAGPSTGAFPPVEQWDILQSGGAGMTFSTHILSMPIGCGGFKKWVYLFRSPSTKAPCSLRLTPWRWL